MELHFAHEPLDSQAKQIRLVQVLPILNSGYIQCHVGTVELDAIPTPDYRAVSYTWGPEQPTRMILMNGLPFIIRENLFNFLEHFRVRLETFSGNGQYELDIQFLWIDQLCIDQENGKERNHQVQMMSEIYKRASYVYVWLGVADTAIQNAMNILKSHYRLYHECKSREHKSSNTDNNKDSTEDTVATTCGAAFDERSPQNAHLLAFFANPYWCRTWIVQEIMFARYIRIFCGSIILSWDELKRFCLWRGCKLHIPQQVNWLAKNAFSDKTFDYSELLSIFSESVCSDPRDKIYGLLGLVHQQQRIEVDYSQPVDFVFREVGLALLSKYQKSKLHLHHWTYEGPVNKKLASEVFLNAANAMKEHINNAIGHGLLVELMKLALQLGLRSRHNDLLKITQTGINYKNDQLWQELARLYTDSVQYKDIIEECEGKEQIKAIEKRSVEKSERAGIEYSLGYSYAQFRIQLEDFLNNLKSSKYYSLDSDRIWERHSFERHSLERHSFERHSIEGHSFESFISASFGGICQLIMS
jgi:hypothetical protein